MIALRLLDRLVGTVASLAAALTLFALVATAFAWMDAEPQRWFMAGLTAAAAAMSAVAFLVSGLVAQRVDQAEEMDALAAAGRSTLAVHERFVGRVVVALAFAVLFGWITYRDIVERDPAAGPVGVMLALAMLRLGWLAWRRSKGPLLLETSRAGLFVDDVGTIECRDLVGIALREVRLRFGTRMYLDLCVRRPDRYGLPTVVRAPGRDGFGLVSVPLRFASVRPRSIEAAVLAARRREPTPFVAAWASDMTGAEIHADLDEAVLVQELESIEPALDADGNIPARAVELLARAPDVIRAAGVARVGRIERARRHARALLVVTLCVLVLFAAMRWAG